MPNMVINLFSGIIFKPMQTSMAVNYYEKKYKNFWHIIFRMFAIIAGFTLICEVGAYILGIPVLSWLYGVNLKDYKMTLLLLLLCGGVNAVNIIFYYVLAIMRKQKYMTILYLIVCGVALIIMDPITGRLGLNGAALGYLILVVLLGVLLMGYILYQIRKDRKKTMSQNEQYDPKVLRKLQLAELEVFKDFIKICDENGLSYFLFAGCAIGVERHKGFIPWDDDIDIGMLRDDYEKVLKIYREKYTDKYVVLDIDSQETFPFYNAEIARIGTKNIPYVFKDANVPMGIDIALYPYDNVPDDAKKRRRQRSSVFFWSKLRILREFKKPVLFMHGWKRKVVSAMCIVMNRLLTWTHFSRKFINRRYMKSALKYNNEKTRWVACFFGEMDPLKQAIKLDDLFPLVEKPFEDIMVKVPKNNDVFLKRMFGDYMKMPPVESRKNHVPEVLEFGPFDEELKDIDI